MSRVVEITEFALRDAHQSLLATRMGLDDMIPVCEEIDNAGYWSVECWGGATYDSCIRFLNEDPWERLRTFRKLMPKSRLQMLLRGQNLLGYRHYEDSVVERFVEKSAENGMDVFRIFDALNDVRNLRTSIAAVKRTGKHAQGTISYTVSPLHTVEAFAEMAEQLQGDGLRLDLHQRHGRAAAAAAGVRPGEGDQGAVRGGYAGSCSYPCDDRRNAGFADEGHRGGLRYCGYGGQFAFAGTGTQSDREPDRDAGRHRLRDPRRPGKRVQRVSKHSPRSARATEVFQREHGRGYGDLQEPDSRRHDLQYGEPAQGPGRRRPLAGGSGRGAAGAQGLRLSAAGDADQPDRGFAGGLQCSHGQIQGADRRVCRPDAGLLRQHDW